MTTNSISGSSRVTDWMYNLVPSLKQLLSRLWDLFINAVLQVRIWDRAYPGLMHALIFGGVTIQVLGTFINLTQMALFIPLLELPFPRGTGYFIFELVMDLAGMAILVGVAMALFRRLVLRPKVQETSWDDYYQICFHLTTLGCLVTGGQLVGEFDAFSRDDTGNCSWYPSQPGYFPRFTGVGIRSQHTFHQAAPPDLHPAQYFPQTQAKIQRPGKN